MEARLARADLELLRWQLQPHFLFNALNTVSTLVLKQQGEEASHAIDLIARYLRATLSQHPEARITVAEELAAVKRYTEIERLRFGEELRVETRIDAGAMDVMMPSSLLQPLVENAIRHGGRERRAPIVIEGGLREGRLRLSVVNSGSSNPTPTSSDGFGLKYVRERLLSFHGDDAAFQLSIGVDETRATIELPVKG